MQQKVARLTVTDLVEANYMLSEILKLKPTNSYNQPSDKFTAPLMSISDSSHGGKVRDYGQTGGILGLQISDNFVNLKQYHVLNWTSHKQKIFSHLSFGAEIISAAYIDDRGYYPRETIREIFPHTNVDHEMIVDSKTIFDTITTLHEAH